MKFIYFFLLVVFTSNLYGQTDSIEKAVLYKSLMSKNLFQEELNTLGTKWNQLIKKINGYPEIPLDRNGDAYYSYISDFKNKSKEYLFNRSLEWLSIKYSIFPSYIYSNLNDGKIIYNNSFKIDTHYSSSFTCIITIKDEKVLVEFINIEYQVYFEGHYSGEDWIPEKNYNFRINQIFPVILKKPTEWEFNLKLLKKINDFINIDVNGISEYILTYDSMVEF